MEVRDLLYEMTSNSKIAIRDKGKTQVDTVEKFYWFYSEDENTVVEEIEPEGYTDGNGISYLLVCVKEREIIQDDELPFPLDKS